jgi:hypothetical protein
VPLTVAEILRKRNSISERGTLSVLKKHDDTRYLVKSDMITGNNLATIVEILLIS